MPAYYDEQRKRWRFRFRGRICGIKVVLTGTPATNTRRAAETEERLGIEAKRRELESPTLTREVPTLKEWSATYLDMQRRDNTPGSVIFHDSHLKLHVLPRFGSKPLDKFGRAEVQDWIDELRDKFSNSHVRGTAITLLGCLRYAHAQEIIAYVPKVALPPSDGAREDFLSEDEVIALLTACKTPEERLIVAVGARGGLRNGEIRGLQPGDWDRESRTLRIRRQIRSGGTVSGPKGNKPRVIPVHADLADALAEIPAD